MCRKPGGERHGPVAASAEAHQLGLARRGITSFATRLPGKMAATSQDRDLLPTLPKSRTRALSQMKGKDSLRCEGATLQTSQGEFGSKDVSFCGFCGSLMWIVAGRLHLPRSDGSITWLASIARQLYVCRGGDGQKAEDCDLIFVWRRAPPTMWAIWPIISCQHKQGFCGEKWR